MATMEKDPRALESESHTASQLNDSNIETMTPFTENRCISHYSDIIAPPAAHIENSVVSPNTSALPDNDESCSAHATEKSLPDSVPSTEDIMLRSLLRGVKGSPSPSRHSHPVTSFSPRRLTEEELYGEPVTNSPIEDVATLKDIDPLTHMPDDDDDDDDDYDFNTGSGARLASSIVAHRSTERDRHRSTTSNNKKDDIGDNKDDSAPRDSASQRNDVNEARVFPNVDTSSTLNASTSINTPTISDDSKEKRRQNYLDSLVASLTEPTSPFSPPSRAPKRVRFDEPEDPFENFNSGSEPEDEADVDFKTASRSPSLRSKSLSSPEPTPPETETEKPPTNKRKGRVHPATVRARRRRTYDFGNWPVATRARQRSSSSASPSVAAMTDASSRTSPADDDRHELESSSWPLPTEARRAADRGVAVSGIPALTTAGHEHDTFGPRGVRRIGHEGMWDDGHAAAGARVGVERFGEGKGRKGGVAEVEEGVKRNGGEWTLVVERDEGGRRVVRWKHGV